MTSKEEFVNKLNRKYAGDAQFPLEIVDDVREFENESGVKFSVIYIGLGNDGSWRSHGYVCECYDCSASYKVDEFPKDKNKSMTVAGIWYDKQDDFVAIDFFTYQ